MGFFDAIFAPGEQARSDDLDRQRADLERRRADLGYITPQQAEANVQRIDSERLNVDAEVGTAFREGAAEGYDNVTGAIKSTVAAPFKFAWASLPWQLILAALVALFLYAGGAVWLRGILAKK